MAAVTLKGVRKVYSNGHVGVDRADLIDWRRRAHGAGRSIGLRQKHAACAWSRDWKKRPMGSIFIGDRDVTHLEPRDRDIAMVFQSYALYPHMTVEENLGFGLKLRGMPANEIERHVKEAAQMLDLSSMMERLPKQLSGGQRQRVALGRALVRHPQVFLLDEPLSNLDAKLRGSMRAEIARLHRQLKTTMIYVTHDQIEAMTLGQRVVVMDKGVIQQIDTPMSVYEQPVNLFVAGFLGNPPMNLFRGRLQERGGSSSKARVPRCHCRRTRRMSCERIAIERSSRVSAQRIFIANARAATDIAVEGAVELVESVGSESFHASFGSVHRCSSRVSSQPVCR